MKMKVLSVCTSEFKDKESGKAVAMNEVFLAAANGKVGSIYTPKPVKVGEEVDVVLDVRDGKFRLKIA